MRNTRFHSWQFARQMIRAFLIFVFLFALYYLLGKNFAFSGVLRMKQTFDKPHPTILKLLPESRVLSPKKNENKTYTQTILTDPVYFEVRIPRGFDKAIVELVFENPSQEIVELGIQTIPHSQEYKRIPLQNKVIDQLDWSFIHEHNLFLFQRKPVYESIEMFLNHPPASRAVFYAISDFTILPEMNILTDISEFDYLLTPYEKIAPHQQVIRAKAEFDLNEILLFDPKLRFMISAPFLDQKQEKLTLHEIHVMLEQPHWPAHPIVQSVLKILEKPWKK